MTAPREHENLPELVESYLAGSLPEGVALPAAVRVRQAGEMLKKPGPSAALHGDRGLRGRPGFASSGEPGFRSPGRWR